MRLFHLFTAPLLIVLVCGADQASADVFISVDKDAQRMAVLVDGEQRHFWRVSTGLAQYDTPTGSFTPFRLAKDHFSKEWDDAPMPHSIFFTTRGHAIHGSDATKRLGSPASHGCIRLSRENAAILFNLVKEQGLENTKVVVTGEDATAAVMARKKDQVRTAERKPMAVARKKDRVQPAERASTVVAQKRDRVRVAERERTVGRSETRRISRDREWTAREVGWVEPYYQQPQPFWSPWPSYSARSYGWR